MEGDEVGDTDPMRSPRTAVHLLLVALLGAASLAACGDDGSSSSETLTGEADGPVVSIDVDDPGWNVATSGFQLEPGEIPVRVTNSRAEAVDVAVFLAPEGYEPGAAVPDGTDTVLEETVGAGEEVQVTVAFVEAGEYAIWLDPLTVGGAQRIGQTISIVDG